MDERGRELRLVMHYIDGIVLSDPVKLVVRDSDHRTIAETGRGRTLSVICVRSPACVVFVYEMFSPVPNQIWRLNNGRLEETHSTALAVLGVIAPLWSDAWGHVVAIGFLLLPWPVCVVLSRVDDKMARDASPRSAGVIARQLAVVGGFIGVACYYVLCAYVILALAEMSPMLTIGSAFAVWGTIAFSLRSGRRAVAAAPLTQE